MASCLHLRPTVAGIHRHDTPRPAGPLWHVWRRKLAEMYGPLNGVRAALVTLAILAALAAAILGQWLVTLILGTGVALHGLGWMYMARHAPPEADPPSSAGG